jgi:hypothetical protein
MAHGGLSFFDNAEEEILSLMGMSQAQAQSPLILRLQPGTHRPPAVSRKRLGTVTNRRCDQDFGEVACAGYGASWVSISSY